MGVGWGGPQDMKLLFLVMSHRSVTLLWMGQLSAKETLLLVQSGIM